MQLLVYRVKANITNPRSQLFKVTGIVIARFRRMGSVMFSDCPATYVPQSRVPGPFQEVHQSLVPCHFWGIPRPGPAWGLVGRYFRIRSPNQDRGRAWHRYASCGFLQEEFLFSTTLKSYVIRGN